MRTLTAQLSGGALGNQLGGFLNGGHWPPLKAAVSKGIRDSLAITQRVHKTEVIMRGIGPAPQGIWRHQTGEASRSFHIAMTAGELEGAYGSELKRVGVLEMGTQEALGGPLRPKNGRYLAIPTDKARKGRGRALSPKDWPEDDLVFVLSRGGNPLLLDPRTGNVMFVLRTQVTIPPRPTMEKAVAKAQPAVDARLLKAVEEGLSPKGLK